MSSANPTKYLGTGADDQALALKMYLGSFASAPRTSIFLWDSSLSVIDRKTVSSGKSHQFLMDADPPAAEEFDPGDEIIGQIGAIEEGVIEVDKYIVASKFIPQDQMRIGHFDILPKWARINKRKIEERYDKRIFTVGLNQARATAVTKNGLTVHNGGNRVTRSASGLLATAYPLNSTGAANFRADLRSLGYAMDIDNLAPDQRLLWIPPYLRQVLLCDATGQVFSSDYNKSGANDVMSRKLGHVDGFDIVGLPNYTSSNGPFPDQNIQNERQSKYNGNFTAQTSDGIPAALSLCAGMEGQAAIGLVTYEDIKSVVLYQPEKLGWLLFSYVLCGAGGLHPWCAGSIEVTN